MKETVIEAGIVRDWIIRKKCMKVKPDEEARILAKSENVPLKNRIAQLCKEQSDGRY